MRSQKTNWRINQQIRAPKVRLIGVDGKQIGVIKLKEALAKSQKAGLDLVEIASLAKPPVVKITDFGKFKYKEEKKLRTQKKKSKIPELKEIRFSPFIGEADYATRLERIKEFLEEKDKIRLVVKFKGRQMGSKQFGYSLLKRILEELGESVAIDMEPKFLGRHLVMVVSPLGKSKAVEQESKKNSDLKK